MFRTSRLKDKSILDKQAEFLSKKIKSKEKVRGKDEVGSFRKQIHDLIKINDKKLYQEIYQKVGDTMQDKEKKDQFWNQWILFYNENNEDNGRILQLFGDKNLSNNKIISRSKINLY